MTNVVKQIKPELVTVGVGKSQRQISSSGQWNVDIAFDCVIEKGQQKWVLLSVIAERVYRVNRKATVKALRRRINKLCKYGLSRDVVFIVDYDEDHHGRARAMKVYTGSSQEEREAFDFRINRMEQRATLTKKQVEQARKLARDMDEEQEILSEEEED